ncbi:MAG: SDR family NAD(P)-dependent oxidoreductase [Solirubrobacteraceae bacterium]
MSAGQHPRVLLVGGTSEIGLAIVRRLGVRDPVRAVLLGRDQARLARSAEMLERDGRASTVSTQALEADNLEAHAPAVADAFERFGGVDVVVLAIGVLGAQEGLDADRERAAEVMRVNFVDSGSLLLECLGRLRQQRHGTLVVLSSVAAERARAGNAIYGAAKAGLDALAQGLADATASTGVRVLVVRPGFVRGRMTAGLNPAPMATTPDAVAAATVRALDSKAHTIWVPGRLRAVFWLLRHLPRSIYRKLPL